MFKHEWMLGGLLIGSLAQGCGNDGRDSTQTQTRESDRSVQQDDAGQDAENKGDEYETSSFGHDATGEAKTGSEQSKLEPPPNDAQADSAEVAGLYDGYVSALCNYYTRCSAEAMMLYGSQEICTTFLTSLLVDEWSESANPPVLAEVIADCTASVSQLTCPQSEGRRTYYLDIAQHLVSELSECGHRNELPCQVSDSCGVGWSCTTNGAECGVCERDPNYECISSITCPGGKGCVGSTCIDRQSIGSACSVNDECVSWRCEGNICVEERDIGDDCTETEDCPISAWCGAEGTCRAPGGAGDACETNVPSSCQIGNACVAGTCRPAAFENVAEGEPCAFDFACVSGTECTESLCVATQDECTGDRNCKADMYCSLGECQPRLMNGSTCESDHQCVSRYCSEQGACAAINPCD